MYVAIRGVAGNAVIDAYFPSVRANVRISRPFEFNEGGPARNQA
jgi:hypothetical protein